MASTFNQALSWPFHPHWLTQSIKGSIHIPLNKIQLVIRGEVLCFRNVNGGNCEALPPRSRNHAVDTHEVRGSGLFRAPINIVEFCWPSLGWHRLSLSVPIDTLFGR